MDNVFHFRVRKSIVWRVILDVNPGNHYKSHVFDNIYQIIMGIIDKNYLNRINQKVQNDLSKQPCGCDCNCRPKFEDDGTPVPPGCNCLLRPEFFVGDWQSGGFNPYQTPQIFLNVVNGQDCPFELVFSYQNSTFINLPNVVLIHNFNLIFMNPNVNYTITMNPGEYIEFSFGGIPTTFDQQLFILCANNTCNKNYGVVGSWTLVAI